MSKILIRTKEYIKRKFFLSKKELDKNFLQYSEFLMIVLCIIKTHGYDDSNIIVNYKNTENTIAWITIKKASILDILISFNNDCIDIVYNSDNIETLDIINELKKELKKLNIKANINRKKNS